MSLTEQLHSLLKTYAKSPCEQLETEIQGQYQLDPEKFITSLVEVMKIYEFKNPFDIIQLNYVFNQTVASLLLSLIQQYFGSECVKSLYLITLFASCVLMEQISFVFTDKPLLCGEIDEFNKKFDDTLNRLENSNHFELLSQIINLSGSDSDKISVFTELYARIILIFSVGFRHKKKMINFLNTHNNQRYMMVTNNDASRELSYACYVYTMLHKLAIKLNVVLAIREATKRDARDFWKLLFGLSNFLNANQPSLKRNEVMNSFIKRINDSMQCINSGKN